MTLEQGVAVRDAVGQSVAEPDTLEEPEAERQRDAVGLAEGLRKGDPVTVPQPDAVMRMASSPRSISAIHASTLARAKRRASSSRPM